MNSNTLEQLRKEIDMLDEELLRTLAKRFKVVQKVGQIKKEYDLGFVDEKRRDDLLEALVAKAEILNISKTFIKTLYTLIHDHAVSLQKK